MKSNYENLSLEELKKVRENVSTRIFRMMIEIAFIFGIPAAIAYFVGDYFDKAYETGRKIKLILLAFTFVFSWIIVIFKYRKVDKEMKEIDGVIKEKQNDSLISNLPNSPNF